MEFNRATRTRDDAVGSVSCETSASAVESEDQFPEIAYLVHDLSDAAVARRVEMYSAGGARVALAGFRRGSPVNANVGNAAPFDLGNTYDGKLAHRVVSVLRASLIDIRRLRRHFRGAGALVARNLEMLVIGARVVAGMHPRPRLVYECLDIHRLLAGSGPAASIVRAVERRVGTSVDLVITSSPAFIKHHIGRQFVETPVILIENKIFTNRDLWRAPSTAPGPPWRIGWFGALRCRRSLELLGAFAEKHGGKFEIVLRGRPSRAIFPDFEGDVSARPHVFFLGPYSYPGELAQIYGDVHFAWCIDFYEEGWNSEWLLPNRLYEGGFHATVPIALSHTESGAFLKRNELGIALADSGAMALEHAMADMNLSTYRDATRRITEAPVSLWQFRQPDCRDLVDAILAR